MFKRIVFSLIIFSFLFSPLSVQAQDNASKSAQITINYEKVNPEHTFSYGVKRLKEKIHMSLLFFSKKEQADYHNELVKTRLSELKYSVDKNEMGSFELANNRYFTTVGNYTNFLLANNLPDQKKQFIKDLSNYILVLEKMQQNYDYETAQWRFIKHDIDYTQIYIDQLRTNTTS